jgi:serine/threonine protein kinase
MKTVGRYEILREVGRGGMAMVYLARQTDLDRFVALKELGAFHASDPSFAQRFLRESRVAGSLSHPNIVTVHDYFDYDGTPYIAMEYVERGSLRPYIGKMTLAQVGGVLEGLLAGLAHAEQHGVVHRDLKPENLMVTADGRVKIADFGIAKATTKMQTGAFLTATGTTVGTPTYMAPEQAMAQDIGPWTDLYSVGCMAFEMFTGRVPFHDSEAPMAILLRHVNEPIPPVKSIEPSIDQKVSDWVETLLVKDPKKRARSANESWDEFEEIVIGLLGPRWRRQARLSEAADQVDTPKPLTPAPFEGTSAEGAVSDEFESFAWGSPGTVETGDAPAAPPGPFTPPPQPATPTPPEPQVGPPTPPPSPAAPPPAKEAAPEAPAGEEPAPEAPAGEEATPEAPAAGEEPAPEAPAGEEVADETGFVTFGAPAPPPPTDALIPPSEAPPADVPPAEEAAPPRHETVPRADDADDMAPPADETATGDPDFETYNPPPPPRPPIEEAPPEEPAEAPEPEAAPPAPPPPAPIPEPVAPPPAPEPELEPTVAPSALREEPKPAVPAEERAFKPFPIVLVAGAVLAAILGFVIGGSGGGGESGGGPPTVQAANAAMKLKVPEGWSRLATAPAVPGLDLEDPIANAPGADGETVIFGTVAEAANNSTLLPEDLIAAAGEVPRGREAVNLGPADLQAYRYEDVRLEGLDRPVTLYTVPTTAGVATVACLPGPEGTPNCEAVANTLELSKGEPFPVGPSSKYANAVNAAAGKLTKAVNRDQRTLARARTPSAQAKAARDLRAAYQQASKALSRLELSPADRGANARLVAALGGVAAAYGKAASAADDNDKAAYRKATNTLKQAQQELAGAVEGVRAAGYDIET